MRNMLSRAYIGRASVPLVGPHLLDLVGLRICTSSKFSGGIEAASPRFLGARYHGNYLGLWRLCHPLIYLLLRPFLPFPLYPEGTKGRLLGRTLNCGDMVLGCNLWENEICQFSKRKPCVLLSFV